MQDSEFDEFLSTEEYDKLHVNGLLTQFYGLNVNMSLKILKHFDFFNS